MAVFIELNTQYIYIMKKDALQVAQDIRDLLSWNV